MDFTHSAVVPYRYKEGRLEILLITSRRGFWIIPKGVIEPGMTSQDSAALEALEEAGVKGIVHDEAIGTYEYVKRGILWTVVVYLFRVTEILEQWLEQDYRKRLWTTEEDLEEMVDDVELKKVIENALLQLKARPGEIV